MKRDWEVIRSVLLRVEEGTGEQEVRSGEFEHFDEALVAYNMQLLIRAGLAEGGGRDVYGAPPFAFVQCLTWEGHELLDQIRSDTVWNRIKAAAKEKGIDLTVDAVKVLAKIVMARMLSGG